MRICGEVCPIFAEESSYLAHSSQIVVDFVID